jgi:hypothetical protein
MKVRVDYDKAQGTMVLIVSAENETEEQILDIAHRDHFRWCRTHISEGEHSVSFGSPTK